MKKNSNTIRVFPRRTQATPTDKLAFVGDPPLFRPDPSEVDTVDISVTFTWDIMEARRLLKSWRRFYPVVRIGGPAFGDPGGNFEPGRYIIPGYTVTSRGCPRRCPFCLVPGREGAIRRIPITDGHNLIDNNILAAGKKHFTAVAEMLTRQARAAEFTGGLDARLLTLWHIDVLSKLRIRMIYTAYDDIAAGPAVSRAIRWLRGIGVGRRKIGCYVLAGYEPGDTVQAAEARCQQVWQWGGVPFAMYYRPQSERSKDKPTEWAKFVRLWTRRQEIYSRMETL